MKKALKSQLLVAVAMLAVAAIALTGATYAWFTSVKEAVVDSINLQVQAADGLLLSAIKTPALDNTLHWKSSISQTEIVSHQGKTAGGADATTVDETGIGNGTDGTSLFPVLEHRSAVFGTAAPVWKKSDDKGATYADAAGGYSKFDLWAKAGKDGKVFLDATAYVKAVSSKAITNDAQQKTDSGMTNTAPKSGIANCVRVAFVPYANSTDTNPNWTKAVVWEPNHGTHLAVTNGGPSGLALTAYSDAITAIGGGANALAVSALNALVGTTNKHNTSSIELFSTVAEVGTKFQVFIWIEGTDVDTIDNAANSFFNTYLKFSFEATPDTP